MGLDELLLDVRFVGHDHELSLELHDPKECTVEEDDSHHEQNGPAAPNHRWARRRRGVLEMPEAGVAPRKNVDTGDGQHDQDHHRQVERIEVREEPGDVQVRRTDKNPRCFLGSLVGVVPVQKDVPAQERSNDPQEPDQGEKDDEPAIEDIGRAGGG